MTTFNTILACVLHAFSTIWLYFPLLLQKKKNTRQNNRQVPFQLQYFLLSSVSGSYQSVPKSVSVSISKALSLAVSASVKRFIFNSASVFISVSESVSLSNSFAVSFTVAGFVSALSHFGHVAFAFSGKVILPVSIHAVSLTASAVSACSSFKCCKVVFRCVH